MQLDKPFATVTPTMDGDVLAVLATHDVSFTTGQVKRILLEYSDEGIRKVLNRLTNQGVVIAERVGNAYTYRLNEEHLAAGPIRQLARLGGTYFERIEEHLASWREPAAYAAVFGSAARGAMTTASDLDILLVRNRGGHDETWDRQVSELSGASSRWTGNDTRIVEYTVDELPTAADEPLLRDVLDQGLTVAGSRSWLVRKVAGNRDAAGR